MNTYKTVLVHPVNWAAIFLYTFSFIQLAPSYAQQLDRQQQRNLRNQVLQPSVNEKVTIQRFKDNALQAETAPTSTFQFRPNETYVISTDDKKISNPDQSAYNRLDPQLKSMYALKDIKLLPEKFVQTGTRAGNELIYSIGFESYRSWILMIKNVDWHWATMNGSLHGFLSRTFSENPHYSNIINSKLLIDSIWILGFLIIGTVSVFYAATDSSKNSVDRSFSIIIISSLLMSPLGWLYYSFLIAAPLTALIYEKYKTYNFREFLKINYKIKPMYVCSMFIIILGFFLPYPFTLILQPNPFATVTVGSIYFWMFLSIWVLLLQDCLNHRTISTANAIKDYLRYYYTKYNLIIGKNMY